MGQMGGGMMAMQMAMMAMQMAQMSQMGGGMGGFNPMMGGGMNFGTGNTININFGSQNMPLFPGYC